MDGLRLLVVSLLAASLGVAGAAAPQDPPCAPAARIDYRVVNVYPHDTGAYTQGLYYDGGVLYEGTGRRGRSDLRVVTLETGEAQRRIPLPDEVFGEGIARFGNRIYQLTWLSNMGFIYAAGTLDLVDYFRYATEGWGLTADDSHLIMSDGSEHLYFLDPASLERVRTIAVHDQSGPVVRLNELEYIDGCVFANVWQRDEVLKISTASGEVMGRIDFSALLAGERPRDPDAVLNGIAWDAQGRRLFVTGKLWPKLFEVRLIDRN